MSAAQFVTGTVTATSGGAKVPTETAAPAPGVLGATSLIAGGAGTVTVTAPGCPTGFILPAGVPVRLVLGGVRLTATSGGTGTVSYAFATAG